MVDTPVSDLHDAPVFVLVGGDRVAGLEGALRSEGAGEVRDATADELPALMASSNVVLVVGPEGAERVWSALAEAAQTDTARRPYALVAVETTLPEGAASAPLLLSALREDARDQNEILAAAVTTPGATTITCNRIDDIVAWHREVARDIVLYAAGRAVSLEPLPFIAERTGTRREVVLGDGAILSYVEYGSGSRVIIQSQMSFPPEPNYASQLAESLPRTRVLEVTLRGFRPSSLVETDLELGWLARWADDMVELADALGIDTFVYTGGSHGGGVGWYLSQRHPERVAAYIGVVSGPHDRGNDTSSSVARRSINDAWPDVVAVRGHMEELVFGPLLHPSREARRDDLIDTVVAEYGEMLPEEARINQGKPWPDATTDDALAGELRSITVPSLLLSGAQDVIITPGASLRAASNVPDAKMVLWQDEGHCTWEEEPRRLVAQVAAYLVSRGL